MELALHSDPPGRYLRWLDLPNGETKTHVP